MKKVILALLIVAMISVSCFSLMACNSGVAVGFLNATTGKDYVEFQKRMKSDLKRMALENKLEIQQDE